MSRFSYRLDRLISQGRGQQILWLVVIVCIVVAIFWSINVLLGYEFTLVEVVHFVMSPGEFIFEEGHLGYQIIMCLVGLVLVSSMLISLLSNIIENRAEAFSKGMLRYRFRDHVLFLGADDMLADTIAGQCDNDSRQSIVVLTEQDAEEVHKRLVAQLHKPELVRRLVVLYGNRAQREQLQSVYAQQTQRVFILGEPDEKDHDSKNIKALSFIKEMATEGTRVIDSYFLCNELNTLRVLQLQTAPLPEQLRLTVMNTSESWAQRVLVSQAGYPPLNRHAPLKPEDKEYVHLVIMGVSQMAYAMAFTAAHVGHYPNYISQGKRTLITLVDPQMDEQGEFLRSRYESLFLLSRRTEIRWEKGQKGLQMVKETYAPEPDNDFLDVEWQFITARPEMPQMRRMLAEWASDEQQMLTIAVCTDDMSANLTTALYLPDVIMNRQIPVLVYQATNAALAQWTKDFTRYKNIYPFGMREDCYDQTFRNRLHWAKQANETYEDNAARLNPQRVRKNWHELKLTLQFSNLYSANFSYCVLRHVDSIYYSRLEHQRWMTERLLSGYKAMDKAERIRIEQLPEAEKGEEMKRLDPYLYHPNIQPFEELTDESARKDEVMARCLLEKMKNV